MGEQSPAGGYPAQESGRVRGVPHGIAWVIGLVALLFAVPAAVLIATSSCACTRPADLVLVNQSTQPVTVDWHVGGVLGTPLLGSSGHEVAVACKATSLEIDEGDAVATVQATDGTTGSMSFAVDHHQTHVVLVAADGRVGPILPEPPPGVTFDGNTCR